MEIEARGYDVTDVLDGWTKWNQMLTERGLSFNDSEKPLPLDVVNQFNEEADIRENVEEHTDSSEQV